MGRPREYTPEKLERAINKYFKSITRIVPVTEAVDNGRRDSHGHVVYDHVPVLNQLGHQVERMEYVLPMTIGDLCRYLKISRSTWANYCNAELHPEFREITEAVRERALSWNEQELLTRPGKDVRGIIFNLQNNFGYMERKEIEMGARTRATMAAAEIPLSEREALLREIAIAYTSAEVSDPPDGGRDYGPPAGAQRSGSGGERKKEGTDMEPSAPAGGGMERVSSDAEPVPPWGPPPASGGVEDE